MARIRPGANSVPALQKVQLPNGTVPLVLDTAIKGLRNKLQCQTFPFITGNDHGRRWQRDATALPPQGTERPHATLLFPPAKRRTYA
jgi:hypothetical protein